MTRFRLALLLTLTLTGCDLFGGAEADAAGDYRTTMFTVTTDGVTVDLLARGASLDLTLDADGDDGGTFSGRLVAPDVDGTGAVDESFSGTYTVDRRGQVGRAPALDALVTFETPADVFVRDAVWGLRGDELSTIFPEEGQGEGLAVTLERE